MSAAQSPALLGLNRWLDMPEFRAAATAYRTALRPMTYRAFNQRLLTLNFAHRRIEGGGDYACARS